MTAPPESPDDPRALSWKDEEDWNDGHDHELDDLPELTVPIDANSLDDTPSLEDGQLTSRLGEPGGEIGIGAPAADEAAIPMLTEVLLTPAPPPPAQAGNGMAEAPEDEAPDLDRLALQVQASVLENLQVRTDALIEGPLDERLQAVIEISTERLVDEIRETLRQAIREAVGRAISEELARVHREIEDHDDEYPPVA